jgi:hypothetical protein
MAAKNIKNAESLLMAILKDVKPYSPYLHELAFHQTFFVTSTFGVAELVYQDTSNSLRICATFWQLCAQVCGFLV